MTSPPPPPSREERLKAALRDNLRRRKDAARRPAQVGSIPSASIPPVSGDAAEGADGAGRSADRRSDAD